MPWFIKWKKKWRLLALGTALLATVVSVSTIKKHIENIKDTRAVAALKNTGFGISLENAKSTIEEANKFFEQAAEYKANAESLQKQNDDANAWAAYQEVWSLLDKAEKSLKKADIKGIERTLFLFTHISPGFVDQGFIDEIKNHTTRLLDKLKEQHDKLERGVSEEKDEIFRRIDAIEKVGEASTH